MKRGNVDEVGGAPSSRRIGDAISSSRSSGTNCSSLPMPWDLTPTLRSIFAGSATPWLDVPKIDRNARHLERLKPPIS